MGAVGLSWPPSLHSLLTASSFFGFRTDRSTATPSRPIPIKFSSGSSVLAPSSSRQRIQPRSAEGPPNDLKAASATLLQLPPYSPDFNLTKTPSASSWHSCGRPHSEPSTASGLVLAAQSIASRQPNESQFCRYRIRSNLTGGRFSSGRHRFVQRGIVRRHRRDGGGSTAGPLKSLTAVSVLVPNNSAHVCLIPREAGISSFLSG